MHLQDHPHARTHEVVNHHPNIFLTWGRVRIELWTHKIDGLHEADFVWAAKADRLLGA